MCFFGDGSHEYNSKVSNQNGVYLLYIVLEIHLSGWEPSVCTSVCVVKHGRVCVCLRQDEGVYVSLLKRWIQLI